MLGRLEQVAIDWALFCVRGVVVVYVVVSVVVIMVLIVIGLVALRRSIAQQAPLDPHPDTMQHHLPKTDWYGY